MTVSPRPALHPSIATCSHVDHRSYAFVVADRKREEVHAMPLGPRAELKKQHERGGG